MFKALHSPGVISLFKNILYWMLFVSFLFLAGNFLTPMFPVQWERFAYGIFGTISALCVTWIILRTENKTFAEYGLIWQSGTIFRFFKGVVIGTLTFLLIMLILLLFTDVYLERNSSEQNVISVFWYLSVIPLALMEEIAFRSYSFLNLNKIFGLRVTQILVAIAFALYHIATGWNFQIAFLGPGIWAFVFGLASVWSKGIAVPTGIHVALNVIQQVIGMQGGTTESIWVLKHPENASLDSIARTDFVGLLTQLLVLTTALILTEIYIRKQNTKPAS